MSILVIVILTLVIISMADAIKQGYLFGQSNKYLSIFVRAGYLDFIIAILGIFAAWYYKLHGRIYIDIIYLVLTGLSVFNGATKYRDFRDKNNPTPKI
jgi:hypothetical protein